MALLEQGTGYIIGTKITTDKLQKDLINNLYQYRNEKIDIKHAKKMQLIGAFVVLSPFITLFFMCILLPYLPSSKMGNDQAARLILLWWLWVLLGIIFASHTTKKYVHHMAIQDPKKEKYYRWNYLVLYDDEIDEWINYINKHPFSRPSCIVEPVILDRTTCKIIGNLDMKKIKERK